MPDCVFVGITLEFGVLVVFQPTKSRGNDAFHESSGGWDPLRAPPQWSVLPVNVYPSPQGFAPGGIPVFICFVILNYFLPHSKYPLFKLNQWPQPGFQT